MPMTPALAQWLTAYHEAMDEHERWDDPFNTRQIPAPRPMAARFSLTAAGDLLDGYGHHLANVADLDPHILNLGRNPMPRRNPQTAPSIIRQPEAPYFLTDGRAVFTGDELLDDARPGDLVYRDGQPVGMVGLDGSGRVVITTNSRTRALAGMDLREGDALQCVDLPATDAAPAMHEDRGILEADMAAARAERLADPPRCDCSGSATGGHVRSCPAYRPGSISLSTTTPAEPGTSMHETLERMLQAPSGARITGINLPDPARLTAMTADMAASMGTSMARAAEAMSAATASLNPSRAASMTDEEIRAAAIRRDLTAPTRAGSIATVEELQERLRDVRATLREVRTERDQLRRDLGNARLDADLAGSSTPPAVQAAVTAAKAWKDTPMLESVAKRDAFLALLATLEVLAD